MQLSQYTQAIAYWTAARTSLHSPQSIGFPPLEEFQRLLDMILEGESLTVESADALPIRLIRLVGFDTRPNVQRLTIVIRLDLLHDKVCKRVGLLDDVVRNGFSL